MLPQQLRSFESDGAITKRSALRATRDDTNMLAHFRFVKKPLLLELTKLHCCAASFSTWSSILSNAPRE